MTVHLNVEQQSISTEIVVLFAIAKQYFCQSLLSNTYHTYCLSKFAYDIHVHRVYTDQLMPTNNSNQQPIVI